MADNICDVLQTGKYKTVRLPSGQIQLISGQTLYTFTDGKIKDAKISKISDLYPNDLSPVNESFVNNGKVYYIRQNKAVVYDGQTPSSFDWNVETADISRLIIKIKDELTGFFVPPNSSNKGGGQAMVQSNDVFVAAYGSDSSLSITTTDLNYGGWNIPFQFNAYIVNSDNSINFFNNSSYCVVTKNQITNNMVWKDLKTLFGC